MNNDRFAAPQPKQDNVYSVGVPERQLRAATSWDYLICLHRAGKSAFDCWPISIRDPLPAVQVPLTDDQSDFVLDLQAAFEQVYDEGPFRRKVTYDGEPIPRLKTVDRLWAESILKARQRRLDPS